MKFDTNFSRNRDSSMWSFVRKHRINWINHTIRADVYLTPNSHRGAVSQVASIASTYSRELDGEFDSRPLARSTKDLFPDRTGQELGDHACARKVYRRHNRHNRDIRLSGTQCCCKSVAVAAAPIAARRAADKRRECIQCNYDVSRRSHSARFFFPLLFSPSPSSFFFLFLFFSASQARARPSVRVHNHSSLKYGVQHCTNTTTIDMYARDERTPRDFICRSARLHRLHPRIYIVSPTSRPLSNRRSREPEEGNRVRRGWNRLLFKTTSPMWNNSRNTIYKMVNEIYNITVSFLQKWHN